MLYHSATNHSWIDQSNYTRTYTRKVYELFGAIKLWIHMSSEDIFLKYINSIERKNNITWRRAAFTVYWDKECKDLSISELFVLLAAAQRGYNLLNESQQKEILERAKWLCSLHQNVCSEIDSFVLDALTYTVDELDPRIQQIVKDEENIVYNQWLADDIDRILYTTRLLRTQYNVKDCCIVVLDEDWGLVRMNMCTQRDDERGKTSSCMLPRQTWSAIKPFLYTYAMNILGYIKEDTIIDEYVAYTLDWRAVYEPKNFDLKYHGEVSLAYALGNSLNIPAVILLERVWVAWFLKFLQEQLTTYAPEFPLSRSAVQDLGLSLALGTYEISPYHFARLRQFFLSKNRSNNYAFYQDQVTTILSNAQNKVDWFGQDNYIHQSWRAIKTGTSRKFIDAWICGVQTKISNAHIACIWMGNISNQAMHGSSSEVAGYVWSRVIGLIEKL